MHHPAVDTLPSTEFSYTRCTELYSSMAAGPYVSHRLCTHHGKSRSGSYTRCTTRNDTHGNAPLQGEHFAANGVFVHPLYKPVQVNGGGPSPSPTGCVHNLGSLAVPCSLGVPLGTALMAIHHSALNTLKSTKVLYTRCTDLYSSMAVVPVHLPQAVYTF